MKWNVMNTKANQRQLNWIVWVSGVCASIYNAVTVFNENGSNG